MMTFPDFGSICLFLWLELIFPEHSGVLQGIAWCFRKCIWLIVTFISVVLIEKSHVGFCARSVPLDFSFQDLQHLLLLLCPIPLVKVLRAGTFNLNTKIWSPDFSIWFCISTEHVRGQNRVKIISSSSRRWWSHPFLHSWLGEVCTNPDSSSFFFLPCFLLRFSCLFYWTSLCRALQHTCEFTFGVFWQVLTGKVNGAAVIRAEAPLFWAFGPHTTVWPPLWLENQELLWKHILVFCGTVKSFQVRSVKWM